LAIALYADIEPQRSSVVNDDHNGDEEEYLEMGFEPEDECMTDYGIVQNPAYVAATSRNSAYDTLHELEAKQTDQSRLYNTLHAVEAPTGQPALYNTLHGLGVATATSQPVPVYNTLHNQHGDVYQAIGPATIEETDVDSMPSRGLHNELYQTLPGVNAEISKPEADSLTTKNGSRCRFVVGGVVLLLLLVRV
jgi:hypothetical protein